MNHRFKQKRRHYEPDEEPPGWTRGHLGEKGFYLEDQPLRLATPKNEKADIADRPIPRMTRTRVYGTFARSEISDAKSITARKMATRASVENTSGIHKNNLVQISFRIFHGTIQVTAAIEFTGIS